MSVAFFCVMASKARTAAGECLYVIPENRSRRGSHFCSQACHDEYRKLRRTELAKRKCRLCGRPMRRPRSAQTNEAKLEPVRSAHMAVEKSQ
jgi:hypothetical protein